MPIMVMKKGQGVKKLNPIEVTQEEHLQKYIHDNPDVIPLDDIRENARLLVLAREVPVASGFIDALAIDDEGAVYIIETKLYKNPDKRSVVAQALDYGAGLWKRAADYSEFERAIDQAVLEKFGVTFRQQLMEFFRLDEEQVDDILDRFRSDVTAGRFTFVVLMDRIPDQLKDLISFINANSNFVLLGCGLELYRYEDTDIVVPELYGAEARKPPQPSRKWDEATFFADVENRLGPVVAQEVRKLYEYVRQTADEIVWGRGRDSGSFNPKYKRISARSVLSFFSNGNLQMNLGWLNDTESALQFRKQFKEALTEKAGLTFRPGWEEHAQTFYPQEWADKVDGIIEAFEVALEKTPHVAEGEGA